MMMRGRDGGEILGRKMGSEEGRRSEGDGEGARVRAHLVQSGLAAHSERLVRAAGTSRALFAGAAGPLMLGGGLPSALALIEKLHPSPPSVG